MPVEHMGEVVPVANRVSAPRAVLPYARDAGGLEVEQDAGVVAIDIPARVRVRVSSALSAAGPIAAQRVAQVGAGA